MSNRGLSDVEGIIDGLGFFLRIDLEILVPIFRKSWLLMMSLREQGALWLIAEVDTAASLISRSGLDEGMDDNGSVCLDQDVASHLVCGWEHWTELVHDKVINFEMVKVGVGHASANE